MGWRKRRQPLNVSLLEPINHDVPTVDIGSRSTVFHFLQISSSGILRLDPGLCEINHLTHFAMDPSLSQPFSTPADHHDEIHAHSTSFRSTLLWRFSSCDQSAGCTVSLYAVVTARRPCSDDARLQREPEHHDLLRIVPERVRQRR
jgi:hypothetical protein